MIGTLCCMAPERLDGRDVPAGDLFALGATLYEVTEDVSLFARDTRQVCPRRCPGLGAPGFVAACSGLRRRCGLEG